MKSVYKTFIGEFYKNLKRIFCIGLVFILPIFLFACGQTENKVEIAEIQVIEHQETMIRGEEYDESSVKLEVKFSDGTSSVYSGSDLYFNYNNFDFFTPGKYTIEIRIIPLKVTKDITVEVKRQTIKILMVENSFGDDTVQWVHEIGDNLGIDFTIAN